MELRFKSYPETHSLLSRVGDDADGLTLDLSNVQFVKPSLLVVVAAALGFGPPWPVLSMSVMTIEAPSRRRSSRASRQFKANHAVSVCRIFSNG